MTMLAVTGGSWILVLVMVIVLGGVAYGYFTFSGSGIDPHPTEGSDGAPGAEGPSEASGSDEGEGSAFHTHGTK
ncbi:MAG: hypothetical protein H0U84_07940 [Thermoleophilaceae bacterium]|nr:hypothetical protein [Thermoleophilaceae bacterium]